jgi:DNA mismatch repair ATPase MutS
LTDVTAINARIDAVDELVTNATVTSQLRETLRQIYDIQRLLSRVTTGRASPRDLAFVGRTLACLPKVKAKLTGRTGALLRDNSVEITNVEQRLKYWINNASRTVLTSGGLAPVLDSGNGEHSVFANAFIDVLADNTTILSGEALHSRVRESIEQDSQQLSLEQTPLFAGLADAGHANGQFVFVPRATGP